MKKDNITISLESEKLRAIKKYMEKKEADLDQEMVDQLQKLYEKYVPANVREYIDERVEEETKPVKPKKAAKIPSESKSYSSAQTDQE